MSTPVLSYTKNVCTILKASYGTGRSYKTRGGIPCTRYRESYPASLPVSVASESSPCSSSGESSSRLGTCARALSANRATRIAIALKSRGAPKQSWTTTGSRSRHPASVIPTSNCSSSARTESSVPAAFGRPMSPRPSNAGMATVPLCATCPGGGLGPTSAKHQFVSYYISTIYHIHKTRQCKQIIHTV